MRLIDADALKARIEQEEDREYDATGYLLHMTDSLPVIDNAPTIDAIPVEWLQKKRKYASEGDSLDVGIAEVLDMWQKEQEAYIT